MFSRVCAVLFVTIVVSACAEAPKANLTPNSPKPHFVGIELIGELKDFAESLGGHPTENFLRHSDQQTADNRCYFTGKLELPEYYSRLRMEREDGTRCMARADRHDVFFYPVEAVASGHETITVSLAEAPTERMLVVVPHEDFHSQREARKAPTEAAEAAATLVGFLTASAFAKEKFGADSATSLMLGRDADLFLRKAILVNTYYEKVSALYKAFRSGTLTDWETLERKAALFEELRESCSSISPEPVSFNKCPAALNNAGLAFDRTYTRNYPMIHELFGLLGGDTAKFVSTVKQLLVDWPVAAVTAADLMKAQAVQ